MNKLSFGNQNYRDDNDNDFFEVCSVVLLLIESFTKDKANHLKELLILIRYFRAKKLASNKIHSFKEKSQLKSTLLLLIIFREIS